MTLAAAALVDPALIPIVVVPTVFLGLPLAIGYARRLWKNDEPRRPAFRDDSDQRLMQMQNSIDAIALEVERISEGQRFVTKVLAERLPESLPAGDAPERIPPGNRAR